MSEKFVPKEVLDKEVSKVPDFDVDETIKKKRDIIHEGLSAGSYRFSDAEASEKGIKEQEEIIINEIKKVFNEIEAAWEADEDGFVLMSLELDFNLEEINNQLSGIDNHDLFLDLYQYFQKLKVFDLERNMPTRKAEGYQKQKEGIQKLECIILDRITETQKGAEQIVENIELAKMPTIFANNFEDCEFEGGDVFDGHRANSIHFLFKNQPALAKEKCSDYIINKLPGDRNKILESMGYKSISNPDEQPEVNEIDRIEDFLSSKMVPFRTGVFFALDNEKKYRNFRHDMAKQKVEHRKTNNEIRSILRSLREPDGIERAIEFIKNKWPEESDIILDEIMNPDIYHDEFDFDYPDEEAEFFEPYPNTIKAYLDGMSEKGERGDVKKLIEYIKKDFNSNLFTHEMAQTLEKIDPRESANLLIRELQSGELGEMKRKEISHILHRIELGKLGVKDKRIVEYFEDRKYKVDIDIESALRLTPDGKVAVMDEKGEILGYFEMGDLSSDEEMVDVKVLALTAEQLFVSKRNESEEERAKREEYAELFKKEYEKIVKDKILDKTKVRLNNLGLKEQMWWFIYYTEVKKEGRQGDIKKVEKLLEKHGEAGIKTFLAMEHDRRNGDVILNLGEQLNQTTGKKVFGKFNEIASFINKSDEDLSHEFFKGDKTINPASEILKRAQEILVNCNTEMEQLDYESMDVADKIQFNKSIRAKLDKIKKEIQFFNAMFKTAFKGKENIDFNKVKGLDYQVIRATEMSEENKKEIGRIIDLNYTDKEMIKFIKQELQDSYDGISDAKFDCLFKDGKIIGFVRFEQEAKGELKAASFNIHPDYRGSAIGEAMLQNSIDIKAKSHKIKAIADVSKPVTYKYINQIGFIVTGVKEGKIGTTKHFNILRDDNNNPTYEGQDRNITQEELVRKYPPIKEPDFSEDKFLLEIDTTDQEEIEAHFNKIIKSQGYYLTKTIDNKYYFFEKPLTQQDYALAA